jgi:integrase
VGEPPEAICDKSWARIEAPIGREALRGHIAKKGNRYYVVIYEGPDPGSGKARHRWHAAGATRKDAQRMLADLVKKSHDGDYRAPDRVTLGEYLQERWLPARKAQLRPTTFDSYRRNIENHVVPAIGAVPLQKLTPEHLDTFYADLLTSGRRNRDGGLSVKTVRYIHTMLHKALADAARKGSVPRNVATLADPPRLSSAPRPEMKVWDAAQLRQFLEGIASHRLYPAFYLLATTGIRRGEVLGLRWRDVDLDRHSLSVSRALVIVAYEPQVSDVKTGQGRRTIDLEPNTVAVLRAWKKRQMEERMLTNVRPRTELIFAHPDGSWINPDYFSQVFDRHVAKSDLPSIRLHDLRHTHASILLKQGIPLKVVSERLGHANPAFTLSVYQHLLPGMQADAAKAFSAAVFG